LDNGWLERVVQEAAAVRRVQRLEPCGGAQEKVFPPTYPANTKQANQAVHVYEERYIDGRAVTCVVLDSVQSQANRLEEVLLDLMRRDKIYVPHLAVDYRGITEAETGVDLSPLGLITSLEASHRVYDATFRDTLLDGEDFTKTCVYRELVTAKPKNATALFATSPNSLLFGCWYSMTRETLLAARFARCLVSEIVGVAAIRGRTAAVRVDPLGVHSGVSIMRHKGDFAAWELYDERKKSQTGKGRPYEVKRPSEIGYGYNPRSPEERGVAIEYGLHTAVISCSGLRRLRFPEKDEKLAWAVLAAMGLLALLGQDKCGYALRSRCDLVAVGEAPFEVVWPDGTREDFSLDLDGAVELYGQAVTRARAAGFPWRDAPLVLVPTEKQAKLIARSWLKRAAGEPEEDASAQG